jgi:hypothetical protein
MVKRTILPLVLLLFLLSPAFAETAADTALTAFAKAWKDDRRESRQKALRTLGKVLDRRVAKQIFEIAKKGSDPLVRTVAFELLPAQKKVAPELGKRLETLVTALAERYRKDRLKGFPKDCRIPVDPKTGDLVVDTPEGRKALGNRRIRERLCAAGIRCLIAFGTRNTMRAETLEAFYLSGCDELVVAAVEYHGAWKDWAALPGLKTLFASYPNERKWNCVDYVKDRFTNGRAKATWMHKYGDPGRQTGRPKVVRALRRAIENITGEKCANPDELKRLLKRKDVKAKVKRRARASKITAAGR